MSKWAALIKSGIIFLVVMSSIAGWHFANRRPSSMDETKHLQLAMDFRDWIARGVPLQNPWEHVYPPAYHFSIIPALSLGVPTEAKAVMTHSLYLVIFLAGCLLLGRALGRSDDESLAAALLTLGYCYVLWAARRALTDFPLMTWVLLAMALLARTDGFRSRKNSVWWGIGAGIGVLVKFTFAFFFILPFLWTFLRSRAPGRFKNALLGLGAATFLGGSWYFWNSAFFFDKALGLVGAVTADGADPHTLSGWLYYLKQSPFQLGFPNLLFTAAGLAAAIWTGFRSRRKGDGLLWMWFFSGYLILSAMMNKDLRHTLPILPAVAFLAVRGWTAVLPEPWRNHILWTAVGSLFAWTVYSYDRPAKENWHVSEIAQLLVRTHDAAQPFLAVSVLSHHPRFFARGLKWSLREYHFALKTTGAGTPDSGFVEYIFLRRASDGTGSPDIDDEWRGTEHQSRAFQTLYHVCAEYTLLDKSRVIVYLRDPHPRFQVSPLTAQAVADRLTHTLRRWVQGPLHVSVEAAPQGLREGHLEKIVARCEGCQVQGVRVQSGEVTLVKPWINLYNLWDQDRIGLLAFESVGTRSVISAEDLSGPLAKIQGVSGAQLELSGGILKMRARVRGIPVQATIRPELVLSDDHPYACATLERIWIAGIPLPGWIIGKAYRQLLWLEPQPSFPGWVRFSRITLDHGRLALR